MAYTEKFQHLADLAMSEVASVLPEQVDGLLAQGAVALDIRDKEEHDIDHLAGSLHVSRGKLEMNIEGVIPGLSTMVLCYCNANNRGALSANTLRQLGYVNARYIAGGLKAYRTLAPLGTAATGKKLSI
jgi:rhodanese-related sulfurtransferase